MSEHDKPGQSETAGTGQKPTASGDPRIPGPRVGGDGGRHSVETVGAGRSQARQPRDAVRTRVDVRNLISNEGTDWPTALVSYQRGVAAMRALDPPDTDPPTPPTDRRSWQFLAAVHGRALNAAGDEDHTDPLWTTCQHGSWFFFPWHRMYLLTLESFIQHFSGDAGWSVPYWYAIDPDDPTADVLPNAFRDPSADNALYVSQRSTRANSGQPIAGPTIISTLAQQYVQNMEIHNFSTAVQGLSFGGGEYAEPMFQHDINGSVESIPHGSVHNYTGTDYDPATGAFIPPYGFMSDLLSAARDPIFWLHHSNIDRLWQMWLDLDQVNNQNPGNDAWLGTHFDFPTPDGQTRRWYIRDVLDTMALGYVYDTVAPPSGLTAAVPEFQPQEVERRVSAPAPPPAPQLIGASVDAPMAPDAPANITLSEPAVQPRALSREPRQWLLRLEGITGTSAAPVYSVYLNLPTGEAPADHPERLGGTFSTFGVREASRPGGDHDGRGQTHVLDITAAHDALVAARQWDPARLAVTFVPLVPPAADEPAFRTRMATAPPTPPDLRVGRIAVLVA